MSETTGGGIEKYIHQIWLGKNAPPTVWMDTVKEFAKRYGYEYKLWTEKNLDSLDWNSIPGLRQEYGKFRKEMAGRADIIRLLALYKFGGLYIDADSVIMKPVKFAKFLEDNKAAVFFGWEKISKADTKKLGDFGPEIRGTKRLVANGVIGAKSGHVFIETLLEGIVSNAKREANEHAWKRVGPLYVSRVYLTRKDEFPDVHIYPMKYFYPMHWRGIKDPALHEKVKIPAESMLFQYGYSTNSFQDHFNALRKTRRKH
jgi:hypothetical protein